MNHVFVFLFFLSGTFNVLLAKWMYTVLVPGNDGQIRHFQHPMFLTALLCVGQSLGFIMYNIVYYFLQCRGDGSVNVNIITRGERDFNPLKMLPPAFLNSIATILLLTGLYLTFMSSFQMIRTCTVIFAGIFSVIHLNTTLIGRHWLAILTIISGIIIIVVTDMRRIIWDHFYLVHKNTNSIVTGDLLIICACIMEAAKMIYEEKYVKTTDTPVMQAIGWQGLFSLLIVGSLTIALNYIPKTIAPFNNNSRNVFDNLYDLYVQIQSNKWLIVGISLFILTTLLHSYTSLTIIKFSSTSNLLFADCMLRSCLLWLIAVLLEWEEINFMALLGFLCVQLGVSSYREAYFYQWYRSTIIYFTRLRYDNMVDATSDPTVGGSGIIQTTNRPADII